MAFLWLYIALLQAVPAYPKAVRCMQPDGTMVTIVLQGDEFKHWAETTDGYTLLRNAAGYWTYACQDADGNLRPSSVIAGDVPQYAEAAKKIKRMAQKHLRFSVTQCASAYERRADCAAHTTPQRKSLIGAKRILVVLAAYPDVNFGHTRRAFQDLYNKTNYRDNNAQGSVHDYYNEDSYGKLNLQADIVGPVMLSHNRSYYGGNDGDDKDSNARAMVAEIVDAIADSVNFSNYDFDNDGSVDGLHIIFAGHGEEAGASSSAIWSHKWSISPSKFYDGVYISSYSCSPECRGNSGNKITRIGVICHELGHVFGADDYYDTDYSENGQYSGTGDWDIMASGSWNNSGITPPHHNPYVKAYDYGWVTPKDITHSATVTMHASTDHDTSYYRINTKTPGEYYLLENKQQDGFNSYVPGHGLLIYHKHASWPSYGGNSTHPQQFYVVCATAPTAQPTNATSSYGDVNQTDATFPGTGLRTAFTDQTIPSAKAWNGASTEKPLTNICENTATKVITFNAMDADNPKNFVVTSTTTKSISLSWQKTNNYDVILIYNTSDQFGTLNNAQNYQVGQTLTGGGKVIYRGSATSFVHNGLIPGNMYYYKLASRTTGSTPSWSSGLSLSAITDCSNSIESYPYIQGFEYDLPQLCWTESGDELWEVGPQGEQYIGPHSGIMQAYCYYGGYGKRSDLISPLFNVPLPNGVHVKLSFWYANPKWVDDQDTLIVLTRTSANGLWQEFTRYNTSADSWQQKTLILPESTVQVCFRAVSEYGYGIYLDDVQLTTTNQTGTETPIMTPGMLTVYPNPASDEIHITSQSNETLTCNIFNIYGRHMLTFALPSMTTCKIGVSSWSNGVYIVQIRDKHSVTTERIIIRHVTHKRHVTYK